LDLKRRTNSFLELAFNLRRKGPDLLDKLFEDAIYQNPWFTKENIKLAYDGLLAYLDEKKLTDWLNNYDLKDTQPKTVGVVMAGNIPLVGIHDLLCVLLSGHYVKAKLSSQDEVLMKFVINELIGVEPEFAPRIILADRLRNIEAVIATGSDNTARYFNYYFSGIPHIIRKNRTSVAILNGRESEEDLMQLGKDIFSYFGLGCRNVSKILLPVGHDVISLFPHWESFKYIGDHHKYHNNYHYQKSIMLVNLSPHYDNGFVLLIKNENLVSPIGTIYYDHYQNINNVYDYLASQKEKIQCIVTGEEIPGKIKFGKAQMPNINDFADNIDTMEFLCNL
jgi:hypothetical protein